MDMEQLRGQATVAFRDLDVPERVTLDDLREILEDDRGKTVVIREVKELARNQISGLWFALPDTDLILHAETSSSLHREQIILHEFAHMALNHERLMDEEEHLATLLPDLSPGLVAKCLARCQRHTDPEIVAETLADLFADALARTRRAGRVEPRNFRGVFG